MEPQATWLKFHGRQAKEEAPTRRCSQVLRLWCWKMRLQFSTFRGDTIYVAIGPGETDSDDAFGLDFTIAR